MEVRLHPLEFARRHLPFVCAVTGQPADWYARVDVRRSIHPAAYLLLFLFPIGWLLFLLVSFRTDGTYVEVPISQYVYDQTHERRRRFRWMLAGLVLAVISFASLGSSQLFPAAWLVFLPIVAMGFWVGRVDNHRVRLSVDGVGLITIHKCHPTFVTAIERWRLSDTSATTQP